MIDVITWKDDSVVLLDQRKLPLIEEYFICRDVDAVVEAIREMVVRGAPAIGVTAAMGVAIAALTSKATDVDGLGRDLQQAAAKLVAARPTAVNLAWAVERMLRVAGAAEGDVSAITSTLVDEAVRMHAEDIATNRALGFFGERLLEDGCTILTHCNAGALATAGFGTALGVVRAAKEKGKRVAVIADETRPFLQGARLTAWELDRDGIPVTVITDGMAGVELRSGRVDAVIVGADRIAANGDVANKIGTYTVAVLAREHDVPFYVAAPMSTIDFATATGDDIPIEERSRSEIAFVGKTEILPKTVGVRNPAFDVTPAKFVSAIITDQGVARAPFTESLAKLKR